MVLKRSDREKIKVTHEDAPYTAKEGAQTAVYLATLPN